MGDSKDSIGIVFKNRVGLYEKELQRATDDFAGAMCGLDTAELNVSSARVKLNMQITEAVNAGLTGTNQQQRDAQLAKITENEHKELDECERLLLISRHKLDVVSAVLAKAKLGMSFIIAAMNAGFVIGCVPDKDLDKEAEDFANKFK